jgi:hypothetical protein
MTLCRGGAPYMPQAAERADATTLVFLRIERNLRYSRSSTRMS